VREQRLFIRVVQHARFVAETNKTRRQLVREKTTLQITP
jgi:hypothetical protein